MHEYSLAVGLMECVLDTASANSASVVNHIRIKVGKMAHINPMQLEFCLKSLSEETIANNAAYTFELTDPDIQCDCGYFGKVDKFEEKDMTDYLLPLSCPVCGKTAQLAGGADLSVQSIDID